MVRSCCGSSATVVQWRGFPFGITESPVKPFEDGDIVDYYPFFHEDSALVDFFIWTLVSFAIVGFVAIGVKNDNIIDGNEAYYLPNRGKADNK